MDAIEKILRIARKTKFEKTGTKKIRKIAKQGSTINIKLENKQLIFLPDNENGL